MTWTVHTLDLGLVQLSRRRMIANAQGNATVQVPVQSWLLTRDDQKVVIDTGFRNTDVLSRLGDGVRGFANPDQNIVSQLALHNVKPCDVTHILHTHLHLDHAGQTDVFPDKTVVVVNRRELEYAASGLSGPSYPPEDIKHLIDRMHTPGALQLLDLELTDQEDILNGIWCAPAHGHTEGSMLIFVETVEGLACFCGDLIYSVYHQLCARTTLKEDPVISANTVLGRRREKASLKKMLRTSSRLKIFPSHDQAVWISNGSVESKTKVSQQFASGCWCRLIENPFPSLNREGPS